MTPAPGTPECTDCGVCCFSNLPEYVRVFGHDWDRMGDEARTFTPDLGTRGYLRLADGHCAALTIDPAGPRFHCAL